MPHTNKCSGLSKSITNLKEIKLTVDTMLKCGFFSYNVAHPYIAKLKSIRVIITRIVSEG